MNHHLQIEELVSQGDAEVVFRATEDGTGRPVLLRRFLPFGRDGRGLLDDERASFDAVIRSVRAVVHPALCPVLTGGVDPVDGIPFMAEEWMDGWSLEQMLEDGLLPPATVMELMDALLAVAGLLSAALGRDGLWVETQASSIRWVDRGGGCAPVLRISPWHCLWAGGDWPVASELVQITETALGWQGVMVSDQAGGGLGGWVKWLRAHPAAGLAEARETLTLAIRGQLPLQLMGPHLRVERTTVDERAIKRPKPASPSRLRLPRVLAVAGLALMVGGAGWWVLKRPPRLAVAKPPPAGPSNVDWAGAKPPASLAPRPAAVVRPSVQLEAPVRENPAVVPERPGPPRRSPLPSGADDQARVFQPGEIDLIMARFHREIVMEGVPLRVSLSANRRTWYLEFTAGQSPDTARAFLPARGDDSAADLERVKALVGKRIRVRGVVDGEIRGPQKVRRPKIIIKTREALEVLD